jgi:hypothetical protein
MQFSSASSVARPLPYIDSHCASQPPTLDELATLAPPPPCDALLLATDDAALTDVVSSDPHAHAMAQTTTTSAPNAFRTMTHLAASAKPTNSKTIKFSGRVVLGG